MKYRKGQDEILKGKYELRKKEDKLLKKEEEIKMLKKENAETVSNAVKEGSHAAMLETTRKMLAKHYDIDAIAEMTELTVEEIQKL